MFILHGINVKLGLFLADNAGNLITTEPVQQRNLIDLQVSTGAPGANLLVPRSLTGFWDPDTAQYVLLWRTEAARNFDGTQALLFIAVSQTNNPQV